MRIVFFLLAVAAAGYAGYLQFYNPSLYTSYSEDKLAQLEKAYDSAVLSSRGEAQDANRVSQLLLARERTRRLQVRMALGAAGACLVLGLVLTLLRGRGGSRDDEQQARDSGHDPRESEGPARAGAAMTREQAAALLGVQPHAPRAVVEAALQAQLAEREPSRLVGLDPTLKHNVLQQREELMQAGNVLLGRQEIAFKTEPPGE